MIKSIFDLLNEIKRHGVEEIGQYININHNPTIGEAFEGLTKKIVEKAIFERVDLKVVSGFIVNSKGQMSKQIDCMVVIGTGKPLPYTDKYCYLINQVIMVIEVKKNLHSCELIEGYENLRSVYLISEAKTDIQMNMIEDAFSSLLGKPFPDYKDIDKLSIRERLLYHTLIYDAVLPIRVIFGFNGFKGKNAEKSLRDSFVKYLKQHSIESFDKEEQLELSLNSDNINIEKKEYNRGYGASALPNLIISGEYSLIKTNGMPYALSSNVSDNYILMASFRKNPLLVFIELLWTRLTYHYKLSSDVFSGYYQNEVLMPLISAFATKKAWVYRFWKYDEKIASCFYEEWSPIPVNIDEFSLLNCLCKGITVKKSDLLNNIKSKVEVEKMLKHLSFHRLIYFDSVYNDAQDLEIKLLTKDCLCIIHTDGRYLVGDDYDGRFSDWIRKQSLSVISCSFI